MKFVSMYHSLLTHLDNIGSNILQAGVDLLPHEFRRSDVDTLHPQSVLGSKSSGCGQGIALVSSNDLLICLEAPEILGVSPISRRIECFGTRTLRLNCQIPQSLKPASCSL
jgi:hypothetical protein